MEQTQKVIKIRDGTVLDHLPPNSSPEILKILDLLNPNDTIIVGMNVYSQKISRKDIIKIENKFLTDKETAELSLIAPNATINIIKNYSVVEKRKTGLPEILEEVVICPNQKCVTNSAEPYVVTKFLKEGDKYRCYFCERLFPISDLKIKV
jgi:aspartate carbamoyltransferase regulatory subunit